jgi:hypothetical protein
MSFANFLEEKITTHETLQLLFVTSAYSFLKNLKDI